MNPWFTDGGIQKRSRSSAQTSQHWLTGNVLIDEEGDGHTYDKWEGANSKQRSGVSRTGVQLMQPKTTNSTKIDIK